MGIESWVRNEVFRDTFKHCIKSVHPKNIQVYAVDMMQYMKTPLPDTIYTVDQLVKYYVRCIKYYFNIRPRPPGPRIVVAIWDKASPPVKKAICHSKRYSKVKRLPTSACPRLPPYIEQPIDPCYDDDDDESISETEAQRREDEKILGKNWIRFAGNNHLLQRELYPRLWNALLDPTVFHPAPGDMLIDHGLPSQSRIVQMYQPEWKNSYAVHRKDSQYIMTEWTPSQIPITASLERADPGLYNRVYIIEGIDAGNGYVKISRRETCEMHNSIIEADNACFYYQRFYPNFRYMVCINDGDAFPISLLQACERNLRVKQYLCLPDRRGKKKTAMSAGESKKVFKYEYVDVNKLYKAVQEHPPFQKCGVSNGVVTLVFLIVLTGTDFFQKYAPGIGHVTKWKDDEKARAKQTHGIWDTFWAQLQMFTHLVQWNSDAQPPDPTAHRRIVIDEELFTLFTYYCYMNKYGKRARKKLRLKTLSIDNLRVYCSGLKKKENHLPDQQQIRLWARQILWNMMYWLNAPRNITIDPCEQHKGQSYYGYEPDEEEELRVTARITPKQKRVDEAYKRHFYRRKKKRKAQRPDSFGPKIIQQIKNMGT